jgi:hypothetical protein
MEYGGFGRLLLQLSFSCVGLLPVGVLARRIHKSQEVSDSLTAQPQHIGEGRPGGRPDLKVRPRLFYSLEKRALIQAFAPKQESQALRSVHSLSSGGVWFAPAKI